MSESPLRLVPESRVCSTCKRDLPLQSFYKDQRVQWLGVTASCKVCISDAKRIAYVANREKRLAAPKPATAVCYVCHQEKPSDQFYKAAYKRSGVTSSCAACRRAHYVSHKGAYLRRHYGITEADYDAIWEKQGGRCALCLEILVRGKTTHIDHCHKTKRVRGLLHGTCNQGLGLLGESLEILARAAAYLREHGK